MNRKRLLLRLDAFMRNTSVPDDEPPIHSDSGPEELRATISYVKLVGAFELVDARADSILRAVIQYFLYADSDLPRAKKPWLCLRGGRAIGNRLLARLTCGKPWPADHLNHVLELIAAVVFDEVAESKRAAAKADEAGIALSVEDDPTIPSSAVHQLLETDIVVCLPPRDFSVLKDSLLKYVEQDAQYREQRQALVALFLMEQMLGCRKIELARYRRLSRDEVEDSLKTLKALLPEQLAKRFLPSAHSSNPSM